MAEWMQGDNQFIDPWGGYRFALFLDDDPNPVAYFMECSGLKSTAEVFEIQEGGRNGHVHKMPGRSKWDNIVLKYATSIDERLMRWRDKYITDNFWTQSDGERYTRDGQLVVGTTGAIVMYDNDGFELRSFHFVNCWPVGWEGPTLNAGGSELGMETLEIAHEGIYIDMLPPPEPEPVPEEEPPERLDVPSVGFAYNSSALNQDGKEACSAACDYVEEYEIEELWIEGHTCTMGSFAYNRSLSDRRANSVKREMQAEMRRRNSTVQTNYYSKGFSWKYPIASNQTDEGKSTNRRSEFMTTSWESRGWDDSPVSPESQKRDPPWNHR